MTEPDFAVLAKELSDITKAPVESEALQQFCLPCSERYVATGDKGRLQGESRLYERGFGVTFVLYGEKETLRARRIFPTPGVPSAEVVMRTLDALINMARDPRLGLYVRGQDPFGSPVEMPERWSMNIYKPKSVPT